MVEGLEPRRMLSGSRIKIPKLKVTGLHQPVEIHYSSKYGSKTLLTDSPSPNYTGLSSPYGGITPAEMQGAYGIPSISFSGTPGTGTGETIAILDPGDDTSMVDSSAGTTAFANSDLGIFDTEYGLPNTGFTFTKMGFTDPNSGTPQLTTTLPASNGNNGQDIETSIDVEWAHAIAPGANILLVEGNPDFEDIYNGVLAVDAAASSMHINVLSMSFGGPEIGNTGSTADEEYYDASYFDTPGLVYCASTGDYGAYIGPDYGTQYEDIVNADFPAVSSNVLAVGGTTLSVSGNNYSAETTWGNGTSSDTEGAGGGGISEYEPQPAYQVGKVNGLSSSYRTIPDISMEGNDVPGVPIYDSPDDGTGTGWFPGTVGGTSLACPMMAAVVAIADQGRSQYGLSLLNSSGGSGVSASNPKGNASSLDIHTLLYGFGYSGHDFHDITSGSAIGPSGYGPLTGYDLATGLGTPLATKLDEDLVANSNTVPSWLSAGSSATYNTTTHTLFVYGSATISADPGTAEPTIQASGTADVVTLNPTSGTDIHIQGISLTGGASAVVTSLGSRRTTSNYHLLVVGVTGATVAPMFTVDTTSTLDLADNDMAILYGSGSSPLSTIAADLSQAYDGGAWNDPGLTSSVAATEKGVTALGYGEASALGLTTFDGLTLGGNAVLVKYTLTGDTQLRGSVGIGDYDTLLSNYGNAEGWTGGDFHYAGTVGIGDYDSVLDNYGKSLSSVLG
jgi:subtilase family serine protease